MSSSARGRRRGPVPGRARRAGARAPRHGLAPSHGAPTAGRLVIGVAAIAGCSPRSCAVLRQRGQGDHAPAAPRGHHPPAGARQGPRPGADRGGDLRRVALPRRPDLARRRPGPDADHAGHGAATSRASRAARSSSVGDLPRRRSTSPTAPGTCATCSTATAATRRSRSPPTTAARATSTAGSTTPAARARPDDRGDPVPRDAALRRARARRARRVPPLLRGRAGHLRQRSGDLVGAPDVGALAALQARVGASVDEVDDDADEQPDRRSAAT